MWAKHSSMFIDRLLFFPSAYLKSFIYKALGEVECFHAACPVLLISIT